MTKTSRIAIVGCGLIGRRHAAHARTAPGVALAGVVDPSPESAAFAASLGAPHFADFDAMLASGRPDGVVIATPNSMHVEGGLAAIAAGLPTLVEKPIADDPALGARLVAAAARAGVPLLVGHHRRHGEIVRRAKEIVASGRLGRVVAAHAFFWLMKPDDYFDVGWRREKGAGPILVNLVHDVDLLRHLVGEIVAVRASRSNAVRGNPVEEGCVALLEFAGGALGTLNASDSVVAPWSWEHSSGENPSYPRAGGDCYFLGGTKGSLSVPRLETWENEGAPGWLEPFRTTRATAADRDPLAAQMAHFGRVIRGEETPLVSGAEGLATLRAVHAIARAAETGERVEVAPG